MKQLFESSYNIRSLNDYSHRKCKPIKSTILSHTFYRMNAWFDKELFRWSLDHFNKLHRIGTYLEFITKITLRLQRNMFFDPDDPDNTPRVICYRSSDKRDVWKTAFDVYMLPANFEYIYNISMDSIHSQTLMQKWIGKEFMQYYEEDI